MFWEGWVTRLYKIDGGVGCEKRFSKRGVREGVKFRGFLNRVIWEKVREAGD